MKLLVRLVPQQKPTRPTRTPTEGVIMPLPWRWILSLSTLTVGALLAVTQYVSLLHGAQDSNLHVAVPLAIVGTLLALFGVAAIPPPKKEQS